MAESPRFAVNMHHCMMCVCCKLRDHSTGASSYSAGRRHICSNLTICVHKKRKKAACSGCGDSRAAIGVAGANLIACKEVDPESV